MATLSSRINTVTSNLKTAKKNLKTAVVNKGGTISASSPTFAQIIAGINSISGAKIQYKNYNVLSNSTKELTYSPVKSTITSTSISSNLSLIEDHPATAYGYSYGRHFPNLVKDNYIYCIWSYETSSGSESSNYRDFNIGVDRIKFEDGTELSTLLNLTLRFVYYTDLYCYPKVIGESYLIVVSQYYSENSYFKLLNLSTLTISDFSTINTNSLRTIAFAPCFDEETGFIYACEDGGGADWLQIYKIDTATATLSNLRSFGAGSPNTSNDFPQIMPNSSSKKIFWTYSDTQDGYNKFGLVYNINSNTYSHTYGTFKTNLKYMFGNSYYSLSNLLQEYDSNGNLCFPFCYEIKSNAPSLASLNYNFSTNNFEEMLLVPNCSNLTSSTLMPLRDESYGPLGYKKKEHFIECSIVQYKTNYGYTYSVRDKLPNSNYNWCYYKKMITYCQLPVFKNATYKFDLPIVIHENYKIIKEVAANTSYKLTSVNKYTQIAVNLFAISESSITDTLVLNGTITLPIS